jgi:MFS family permease
MIGKLRDLFGRFPKVFWTAQTFELLERGAYYSMMPIIVVHAIYNVGLPIWLGAIITVFMYPFQYGLPMATGALAEKVGYKRQIILAFLILTSAYIFLALAFNTATMIFSVMAVGIGIGTYKPLISATVAKCTSDKDRNLAYSIYYWIVNLAAFLIPLMFALMIMANILTQSSYYIIFLAGAGLVSINVITAITIFEEVPRSGKVKTVGDAVNNIKIAMRDKKFVVMVLLIGGFWALYSTMLNALPLIMFGFDRLPEWFDIMLLGVFNPMTIIIAGIPLAKFIEKVESMRVVLAGIMIYLIGMAIIGFTLQWEIVIFGIIIVSIGEFIVAPGYMAFVSKLAPKDKVSAYVGCNFLSYMIGLLGGTFVFGLIVTYVGTELEMPHFFYGITIAIGLALLIAFIVYYWTWGQDIIQRAKRIRELEEGISEEPVIPSEYKEPILFRIFDNKMSVMVCLVLIPIILITTMGMPRYNFRDPFEEPEEEPKISWVDITFEATTSGYTNERQSVEMPFTIGDDIKRLTSVSCTLTWTDEPSQYFQGTNEPDEFQVSIQAPNGDIEASGFSTSGSVSASMEVNFTQSGYTENYIGQWVIIVEAGDCGDDSAFIALGGVRTTADDGNDWDLEYSYVYEAPEENQNS